MQDWKLNNVQTQANRKYAITMSQARGRFYCKEITKRFTRAPKSRVWKLRGERKIAGFRANKIIQHTMLENQFRDKDLRN